VRKVGNMRYSAFRNLLFTRMFKPKKSCQDRTPTEKLKILSIAAHFSMKLQTFE